MKLKYTLMSLLALSASSMAHADILRFHYMEYDSESQQNVERTKDFGVNNFHQITREQAWSNTTHQYDLDVDILGFGEYTHADHMNEYASRFSRYVEARNFLGIELLHPEKVEIDLDIPDIIWLPGNNGGRVDYCLEYTGRVRFVDGADKSTAVSGSISFMSDRPKNNNYHYFDGGYVFKSKPEAQDEAISQNQRISFVNYSENVSPQEVVEGDVVAVNYTVGGNMPDEATFSIRIPALSFWPTHVVLSEGEQVCDMANIDITWIDDRAFVGNWYYGDALHLIECMKGEYKPAELESEFYVSAPITWQGGHAKIGIDELRIDGTLVPSEEVGDYVQFTHPWEFDFDRKSVKPRSPKMEGYTFFTVDTLKYNLDKLDLNESYDIQVKFKAELDLGENLPEWLTELIEHYGYPTFSQRLTLYPNRLPIDLSKVSFPDLELTEGSLAALFDDDPTTFCHSSWTAATDRSAPFGSFIDIELDEPVQEIGFAMQARNNTNPMSPTKVRMYYSEDGDNWNLLGEAEFERMTRESWNRTYAEKSAYFKAPVKFKHVRWCAVESYMGSLETTSWTTYWNLAELHFYGK